MVGDNPLAIFDSANGKQFRKNLTIFTPIPYFSLPCSSVLNSLPHRAIEIGIVAARVEYARLFAYDFICCIA